MAHQRQQNWQPNDSGILRKKEEKEEELLVFGYSCKLFRDDEKALYVDQGKHLIPWMGDDSLRIDRYDVRGALYDLHQYEAMSGQQEEMVWVNMSSEERRIEQLCDQERYRALTHNEEEERLYQEEELKRLHQALGSDKVYGQVSYSYDQENGDDNNKTSDDAAQPDETDEPFVPPADLDLPTDMIVPETVKLNAIIEKTAMFINQQGSQMEIILKMKQAANPQFEFLSYNAPLHAYYRHIMNLVKSGRYRPSQPEAKAEPASEEEGKGVWQMAPLTASFNPVSAPSIPSINYKPSSDCAYSMLVNKIKNNQNKLLNKLTHDILMNDVSESGQELSPKSQVDVELAEEDALEHRPSLAPTHRPARRKRRKRPQGGCAYDDTVGLEPDSVEYCDDVDVGAPDPLQPPPPPSISATNQTATYAIPPHDLQLIIDKMASYVAKNGRNFEEIVESKKDPRFPFLDSANMYHMYYRNKVESFVQSQADSNVESSDTVNRNSSRINSVTEDVRESGEKENSDSATISMSTKSSSTRTTCSTSQKPQPVCFSIKRPKETESLEIKSALPVEESSDEGNDEGIVNDTNCNDDNSKPELSANAHTDGIVNCSVMRTNEVTCKITDENSNKENKSKGESDNCSVAKKMQTENVKLTTKEREKQLQLERKKRAAAFLNLLRKVNKTAAVTKPPNDGEKLERDASNMVGPQLPEGTKLQKSGSVSGGDDNEDDDDESDSDSSAPSSVTSPDVTFVGESVVTGAVGKGSDVSGSSSPLKLKSDKSMEKLLRRKKELEYRHKHRKRKRSPSGSRKHHHSPYSSIRPHYHHNRSKTDMSVRRRKHRRVHRKDYDKHSGGVRDYSSHLNETVSSDSLSRRHKHSKLKKKCRRKEEKKYSASKSSSSDGALTH